MNVKAAFFLTARLAPAMATRGDGVVINTGTIVVSHGIAGSAAYVHGSTFTLDGGWSTARR